MKTVKINYATSRPWKWNADKTIKVDVDGEHFATYWGLAKDEVLKIVRNKLGVKRVKVVA